MAKRKDYIGIHKPNKNMNGSVAQFKLSNDKSCMFMELARQVRPAKDPAPFDWKNTKMCVQLGVADIGKLLALFNGTWPLSPEPTKEDLHLFHENDRGNKSIKVKKQDRGYYLKVSSKEGDQQNNIAIAISWDEAELLKIALARAFDIILGWGETNPSL